MKLTKLSSVESAYVQSQLDKTGIHYAVVPDGIEVLEPTLAQRLFVEGVVAVCVAEAMMKEEQGEAN